MAPLVLFDLDNTLLDRVRVFRRWATQWATEQGLDVAQGVPWLEEADGDGFVAREELFRRVKEHFGLEGTLSDMVASYQAVYPTFVQAASRAVRTALSQLREYGYRTGIVTNGPPSQEAKIARMKLHGLIDGWAVSALAGAQKPSFAIFHAAARACGAGEEAWWEGGWMVGDNPEADIAGGRAAGLRTVWLHRDRLWPEGIAAADLVAASAAEAVQLILASGQRPGKGS